MRVFAEREWNELTQRKSRHLNSQMPAMNLPQIVGIN
jgi:hypothetical protein